LLKPNGNNPVRNRADSFLKVFELLDERAGKVYSLAPEKQFNILETGCMRADHGQLCFGDDGCSTYIFDDFINKMGGNFYSVDINPENVKYAISMTSDRANVVCGDSVSRLMLFPESKKFDLIYLDSFDIERGNPHPSQLHHLKELCAVMKNTEPSTIIMVDDHDAFFTGGQIGKGTYVKSFMQDIGAKIIHEGYQIVFQL
jgi:hypothetical protein